MRMRAWVCASALLAGGCFDDPDTVDGDDTSSNTTNSASTTAGDSTASLTSEATSAANTSATNTSVGPDPGSGVSTAGSSVGSVDTGFLPTWCATAPPFAIWCADFDDPTPLGRFDIVASEDFHVDVIEDPNAPSFPAILRVRRPVGGPVFVNRATGADSPYYQVSFSMLLTDGCGGLNPAPSFFGWGGLMIDIVASPNGAKGFEALLVPGGTVPVGTGLVAGYGGWIPVRTSLDRDGAFTLEFGDNGYTDSAGADLVLDGGTRIELGPKLPMEPTNAACNMLFDNVVVTGER